MKITSIFYKITTKSNKIAVFGDVMHSIFSVLLLLLYIIFAAIEGAIRWSAFIMISTVVFVGLCILSILYVVASLTGLDIVMLSIDADTYIKRHMNHLDSIINNYWRILGL
jgi:hypothetical protein